MKNLLKIGVTFVLGGIAGAIIVGEAADKGDVVYDGDDFWVKAEKNKTCNWSYAKVYYKNPQ